MSDDPGRHLRTAARPLDLRQALQSPTHILIGVTPPMADCLKQLGITTIFDLATSRVFANAAIIDRAGEDAGNLFRRADTITADILAPDGPADVPIEELRTHGVAVLAGMNPELAKAIGEQFGVSTVQELANLPAFLAAKELLDCVFFPEMMPGFDPESPSDLVPRNGEYPTERVNYTTLLLDELRDNAPQVDILGDEFQPVDVNSSTRGNWGFQQVAFGTLLTFTQSWYQEGVALGQLLHSAALAPGESTRIAVIDWSRRSRAGQTEQEQQTEDLINDTSQNREINEVTSAVANELQGGLSGSQQHSRSVQTGVSASGPQGGGLANMVTDLLSGVVKIAGEAADKALLQ